MDISKLLNPASESSAKLDRLLVRELPACVSAPREFSKNFLVDDNGSIRLTPPRRTVPCGREEYWLQPRVEYLFGRPTCAPRLSTVRRERHQKPYHRDLKNSYRSKSGNTSNYSQAIEGRIRTVHDVLSPYEYLRTPDCNVYLDMSVDPRAVRTEEEERRVQGYYASTARAAMEFSAATMGPFSEHQSSIMDAGDAIAQPRAMVPFKTSVLYEQASLQTV